MAAHIRRSIALASLLCSSVPAFAGDVSVQLDAGAGFSIKNNTGAIERLRVDESAGNISRNGALFVHTTGTANTFVGTNAGNTGTSGLGRNSAFGQNALAAVTTGFLNSAVGYNALAANTTGGSNTAVGYGALRSNISGPSNSALGAFSLTSNTTGQTNTAVGSYALRYNVSGNNNSAFGSFALSNNSIGYENTAVGSFALYGGGGPFGPSRNTAVGYSALRNSSGHRDVAVGTDALRTNTTGTDNTAVGERALSFNTTGCCNTAVGSSALRQTSAGSFNTGVGNYALTNTTTGQFNTAIGVAALYQNTTGFFNTAVGMGALAQNATASENTAVGYEALRNTDTGFRNVAFGRDALYNNTSGARNVAIGSSAGYQQTTGNDNIYLANTGVAGESGRIRIGTVGTQTQTVVAGISGATSAGGVAVLVNASGVLGTTTSSARFKEDVRDMGDASDLLMRLRPVTFRYTEEAVGAGEAKTPQYGLIAEEVAVVAPELVAPDLEGRPYSVKYHELPALLLNEVQEQARLIAEQREVIAALSARVERLEAH